MAELSKVDDTTETPLLSILVLTYNHESYIKSCLGALSLLKYDNTYTHILDDGSKDETFKFVKEFKNSARNPVVCSTQPNSGGRISLNSARLLRGAKGRYVLFMSGDDVIVPGFDINRVISDMEADENIVISLARPFHVNFNDCSEFEHIYTPQFRELLLSGDPNRVFHEHLCRQVSRLFLQGAVIRMSFLDQIGGFDPSFIADDYALFAKAFAAMVGTSLKFRFYEDNLWYTGCIWQISTKSPAGKESSYTRSSLNTFPRGSGHGSSWDHAEPENFDEFSEVYQLMYKYFDDTATSRLLPGMIRRFAKNAVRRRDFGALWRLASWPPTRQAAGFYLRSRLLRLLGRAADLGPPKEIITSA